MPRYIYFCKKCKKEFQESHSMKDKLTNCKFCKNENSLKRLPNNFILIKKTNNIKSSKKAGEVVKSFIEETKKEIDEEKKKLHQREYKK